MSDDVMFLLSFLNKRNMSYLIILIAFALSVHHIFFVTEVIETRFGYVTEIRDGSVRVDLDDSEDINRIIDVTSGLCFKDGAYKLLCPIGQRVEIVRNKGFINDYWSVTGLLVGG